MVLVVSIANLLVSSFTSLVVSETITSSWIFNSEILCEVSCSSSVLKAGFVFKAGGISF